ncbi:MAG: sodium ABC transporter ATP-binding protein [Planctomycetaceae bacterium]|nr:sodium ABC transporter ATP-binding protein [Planctomycetaceae bacterium]
MIQVSNLTKRFRSSGQEVLAVDRLSFSIDRGEVYGLLGPNGAGKTTTIRMIVGLLQPDEGYASVDGFRSSDDAEEVKSRLGLVSANDGIYPWLTVREMLLFFADLYGVAPAAARSRLEELVALFDLGDYLNRRCSVISTGQRQRVIMARALMHAPPVMLLDEPTRGLDVVGSQVVFDYIQYLRKQGVAVLVSTHRLDEAQRLCNRFGLLHQGRLWQEGTLAELQSRTASNTLVEMFMQLFRVGGNTAPALTQAVTDPLDTSGQRTG